MPPFHTHMHLQLAAGSDVKLHYQSEKKTLIKHAHKHFIRISKFI